MEEPAIQQRPAHSTDAAGESGPAVASSVLAGTRINHAKAGSPLQSMAVSSPFGPRLKASDGFIYEFHRGIDLVAGLGEPVRSIADGTVYGVYHVNDPASPYLDGGNVAVVKHSATIPFRFHGADYAEFFSVYMHLDSVFASPGNSVAMGSTIGAAGKSGDTAFVHLHLEIRVGTPCSREYSLANPQAQCSSFFGEARYDPAINPFSVLDYPDAPGPAARIISASPLEVRIESPRADLDFDSFRVVSGTISFAIGFDERAGIDPANPDNSQFGGALILPEKFSTDTATYSISFRFPALSGFDSIEARDIWGNGTRLAQ